jgi:hypothetical protein
MTALVVYESMFGNTKRIALAVAEGIATRLPVDTIEVGDAPDEIGGDVDLLVVGGPTHVHGMSTARTRESAAERAAGPLVSKRAGIREWLDHARAQVFDIHAAAFDTRINGIAILTGSAAKGYVKGLRSAGFRVDWPPQSFLVNSRSEPGEDALLAGQLEEARSWGEAIAAKVTPGA